MSKLFIQSFMKFTQLAKEGIWSIHTEFEANQIGCI